jgi:hypothetical protein
VAPFSWPLALTLSFSPLKTMQSFFPSRDPARPTRRDQDTDTARAHDRGSGDISLCAFALSDRVGVGASAWCLFVPPTSAP